jgi:hypothetical protein
MSFVRKSPAHPERRFTRNFLLLSAITAASAPFLPSVNRFISFLGLGVPISHSPAANAILLIHVGVFALSGVYLVLSILHPEPDNTQFWLFKLTIGMALLAYAGATYGNP